MINALTTILGLNTRSSTIRDSRIETQNTSSSSATTSYRKRKADASDGSIKKPPTRKVRRISFRAATRKAECLEQGDGVDDNSEQEINSVDKSNQEVDFGNENGQEDGDDEGQESEGCIQKPPAISEQEDDDDDELSEGCVKPPAEKVRCVRSRAATREEECLEQGNRQDYDSEQEVDSDEESNQEADLGVENEQEDDDADGQDDDDGIDEEDDGDFEDNIDEPVYQDDDEEEPTNYIQVPIKLGQMKIEHVMKFPGIQVHLLDYSKVPKQKYNLFIADSMLSLNLGVENDRGVYTADLINKGNIIERVVGKKIPCKARGDKTYVIRSQATKTDYDTLNWNTNLPYMFMALANDPLGAVQPNVTLEYVKKVKLLVFKALRQIQPGEELCWNYTSDGGYWLSKLDSLPERVKQQCLKCYGHRKDFQKQAELIARGLGAPVKRTTKLLPKSSGVNNQDQQILKDAFDKVFGTLNPDNPLFINIVESVMKRKSELERST